MRLFWWQAQRRMTSLNIIREIETSRIDEGFSTSHASSSRRRHTYSTSENLDTVADYSSPAESEQLLLPESTRRKSSAHSLDLCIQRRSMTVGADSTDYAKGEDKHTIMTGWLYKTSRIKNSKSRGHRQHRRFRLTTHSLEYSHLLQKVSLYTYT